MIEDAGPDWELRGWRIGCLANAAAVDDGWVDAWLRAEPADPAAVLIQAGTLIRRAIRARGIASSGRTTAEQFQGFHTHMAAAEPVLRRATELAGPHDPLPWVERMRTMFADQRARESSFDEVYAKREFHWDVTGDEPLAACAAYLRRPEVRDEADRAIAKWRAGRPHPVHVPGLLQWPAVYYTLAGRREQARAVFDEIGSRIRPRHDWAYFWATAETGYLTAWRWANGISARR